MHLHQYPVMPSHGCGHHGSPHAAPTYHGFCPSCCHPVASCCCHSRDCRKEAKELLVLPQEGKRKLTNVELNIFSHEAAAGHTVEAANEDNMGGLVVNKASKVGVGEGESFIGGGCCVHLSVEYCPQDPSGNTTSAVFVQVVDSDGTHMAWGKGLGLHRGYQIQEGIISTRPGAMLKVKVVNMICRVRWCEIFSC